MGIINVTSLTKICITENTRAVTIQNISDNSNKRNSVYFLNYEKINDDKFQNNIHANKTALKHKNNIIHNMYNSQKMYYKTDIYNSSRETIYNNTHDYINQFYHIKTPLTQIEKIGNSLYSYNKNLTEYGHTPIYNDDSYLLMLNNRQLTYNKIQTDIFDTRELKKYFSNEEHDDIVEKTFTHIKYNHIIEISPDSINDYDSGNYHAYVFKAKNELNSMYSMYNTEDTVDSTLCNPNTCDYYKNSNINFDDITTELYDLIYSRKYVGIIINDIGVYLKYYDNLKYERDSNNYDELSAGQYGFHFPHIEQIATISREITEIKNKSTLYSLKINNVMQNIENEKMSENEVNIFQNGIKSIIKILISKFSPLNTQIFNITIN